MLWAPLVIALAQAEPAPAPPAEPRPAPAEPAPAGPAPEPAGPAEPAPAPEPAGARPTPEAPRAPPPATRVGLALRLGTRLPVDDDDLPAPRGFGLGVLIQRRYALAADRIELGAGIDFTFERYSRTLLVRTAGAAAGGGAPAASEQTRQLTHSTFAVVHPVALRAGPVRIGLAAGAGLDVAYYTSDERAASGADALLPDEVRATRPCLRASAALEVAVTTRTAVGLAADYTYVFAKPAASTAAARAYHPIVDRLAAGLTLVYAF